jgi:hypothetical protein
MMDSGERTGNANFEAYVAQAIESVLRAIPEEEREDVYVLALDCEHEDDDPRRPFLIVGWNTGSHLSRARAERGEPARSFAVWERLAFARRDAGVVGESVRDPRGAALRTAWLADQGLMYRDEQERELSDELDPRIWEAFVDLVIGVLGGMHGQGPFERVLGHDIAVFLQASDYDDDQLTELNVAANPPQFHAVVTDWATAAERWSPPGTRTDGT